MQRNLFCFFAIGVHVISSEIPLVPEIDNSNDVAGLLGCIHKIANITNVLKLSVWYSLEQDTLIPQLLNDLEIPVIVNAIEKPLKSGLELRLYTGLVLISNSESIEYIIRNTLWDENTLFLILAENRDKLKDDFKTFWKYKIIKVFEAIRNEMDFDIYGYYPYESGTCTEKPIFEDKYLVDSGKFINQGSTFKDPAKVKNLHQCSLNVTIVDVKPMVMFTDELGYNATKNIDGIEGKVMIEVSKIMNFSATYMVALDGVGWGWINPSPHGAVGEVFTGRSDFAFGLLAPTIERYESLDISLPYNGEECVTFGVPSGAGISTPYWLMILIFEFSPVTWFLIFMFFVVTFYIFYAINKYKKLMWFFRKSDIFLYEFSSCMGLPIKIPEYLSLRLMVFTWIVFCFVVTVAYKSSMDSKLTVPNEDPDINTFDELLHSPLQLTGYNNMLRVMQYNGSEPNIKKIAKRFKVTDFDINFAVDHIARGEKLANMRHTSTFLYYALINPQAKGHIHVMKDCILSFHPIFVTKKHSPFSFRLNQIISRLVEAGIPLKWKSDFIYEVPHDSKSFLKLSRAHMYGVFCVLIGGYLVGIIVLLYEIFFFRYQKEHQLRAKMARTRDPFYDSHDYQFLKDYKKNLI